MKQNKTKTSTTIETRLDLISRSDAIDALIGYFVPQIYTGEQVAAAELLANSIIGKIPSASVSAVAKSDGDLIYRNDALRELNGAFSNWRDDAVAYEIINALPSAEFVRVGKKVMIILPDMHTF